MGDKSADLADCRLLILGLKEAVSTPHAVSESHGKLSERFPETA